MQRPLLAATLLATFAVAPAQQARTIPGAQPVELGGIAWHRDLDAALKGATATRPAFVLFQEVPG